MNHDQSKQRELLDKIRKIISEETAKHLGKNLTEKKDEAFSDNEQREIEQATKKMTEFVTNPRNHTPYTHFNFAKLNKYVNPDVGEIEYEFGGRAGSVQFLWTRERGKIFCEFSVEIGDTGMSDFPIYSGSNVGQVLSHFMREMKNLV